MRYKIWFDIYNPLPNAVLLQMTDNSFLGVIKIEFVDTILEFNSLWIECKSGDTTGNTIGGGFDIGTPWTVFFEDDNLDMTEKSRDNGLNDSSMIYSLDIWWDIIYLFFIYGLNIINQICDRFHIFPSVCELVHQISTFYRISSSILHIQGSR